MSLSLSSLNGSLRLFDAMSNSSHKDWENRWEIFIYEKKASEKTHTQSWVQLSNAWSTLVAERVNRSKIGENILFITHVLVD